MNPLLYILFLQGGAGGRGELGQLSDILAFIGEMMAHIFTAFDAVYILDTQLSILDIWIITMLIGMVMDFISNFIEGYYS